MGCYCNPQSEFDSMWQTRKYQFFFSGLSCEEFEGEKSATSQL